MNLRKKANDIVGKLGNNMGELMESLVEGNLKDILNQREIGVNQLEHRIRKKFKVQEVARHRNLHCFPTQDKNGNDLKFIEREFDIVALGENDVVIVEVKTHLWLSDVVRFLEVLDFIHLFFPEYDEMRIHGAMGFLRIEEEAIQYANKEQVFLIQVPRAFNAEIINSSDFNPVDFLQLEFFKNNLFKKELLKLFQFQGIELDQLLETDTVHAIEDKHFSQRRKFDAVLGGEDDSVILENKIVLTEEDVQDFVLSLNSAPKFFRNLQNSGIFGALAYREISFEAMKEAEKNGVFLISVSKIGPKIENSKSFVRKNFNSKP